ncbi:MAG: homoserine O-acetyltransferase [Candidatus Eremiobacteraeota bacterium]|nr:homoserine O-acetyltransferase [Candidatus Eremiobacteraeota bacterium]
MIAPSLERDVPIGSLALDCGVTLPDVVQRVSIYGEPRADGSNMVLVNHALTGSSRVAEWWGEIVGEGKLFDPRTFAVAGINVLGSCYGSTGPATPAPGGRPYGATFPVVSVGDMVRAQRRALEILGLQRFAVVIGGSLGGMQAIEWAMQAPGAVGHVIAVGAYDHFSTMGIALNAVAREAIRVARTPQQGVELARKIAMLTYKSEALFAHRHGRKFDRKGGDPTKRTGDRFDIEGYLDHQGALFSTRMVPEAYLTITRAMDLFETRDRKLGFPAPRFTFAGISSDWLFLPEYVRAAAARFAAEGADSAYVELRSDHGHDAFLAEPEHLRGLLAPRLRDLYEAAATG